MRGRVKMTVSLRQAKHILHVFRGGDFMADAAAAEAIVRSAQQAIAFGQRRAGDRISKAGDHRPNATGAQAPEATPCANDRSPDHRSRDAGNSTERA